MNHCPICAIAKKVCPQCVRKFHHDRILHGRRARGVTRRALARVIGVSYYRLTEWEKGRQRPTEDQILRLCAALGFTRVFFTRPVSVFDGVGWACSPGGCQMLDRRDAEAQPSAG